MLALYCNIIYRCIIDFQYFGLFHIITMFIILGIGADDLFVFYDAWRLTAFSPYPSLAHRLNEAYSKSCKSMFITSLTTAVAFTASALSPLLATKSFGVFAAILVFAHACRRHDKICLDRIGCFLLVVCMFTCIILRNNFC
jgi:hypothetical protein